MKMKTDVQKRNIEFIQHPMNIWMIKTQLVTLPEQKETED